MRYAVFLSGGEEPYVVFDTQLEAEQYISALEEDPSNKWMDKYWEIQYE